MRKSLTPKQEAFVQEYILNGGNATQAAKKAGYRGNQHTLQTVGAENMLKPVIARAIKNYQDKQKKVFGFTFEDKQKMVANVYTGAVRAGQFSAANSAIDILNRMDGDYATEKREVVIKKPKRLVITVAPPID